MKNITELKELYKKRLLSENPSDESDFIEAVELIIFLFDEIEKQNNLYQKQRIVLEDLHKEFIDLQNEYDDLVDYYDHRPDC